MLSVKALESDAEFAECVEDIRIECERFGRVTAFVVPRELALAGRPSSDVGKCFIEYEDVASAARSAPQIAVPQGAQGAGGCEGGRLGRVAAHAPA